MLLRIEHSRQYRLGMILAFGSLLWSGTYSALAKGLTSFVSPITLLVLSEALTAMFIMMTFGVVPLMKKALKLQRHEVIMAMVVGLMNSALAPLLWYEGLSETTAMNASLLSCADVLTIIILSHFILGENLSRTQIIGGLVILMGIALMNVGHGTGFSMNRGDVMVLAAAVTGGTGSVIFKRYLADVMPELAIIIRNITGMSIVIVVGLFLEHPVLREVVNFPLQKVMLLITFAFFSRYLNLTFYYEALERLPATTLSLVEIGAPLTGLLFAFLILGETLQSSQMLGAIFILFGLLLEQISEQSLCSLRHRSLFAHLPRLTFWRKQHVSYVTNSTPASGI